jgi:hypothetical protein
MWPPTFSPHVGGQHRGRQPHGNPKECPENAKKLYYSTGISVRGTYQDNQVGKYQVCTVAGKGHGNIFF